MASGTATNGTFTVTVPSNSCSDLKTAYATYYTNTWNINYCSSDPVQVGTILYEKRTTTTATRTSSITSITATEPTFNTDFNPAVAGEFYAGALIPIVVLFFTAKGISEVVKFLKNA